MTQRAIVLDANILIRAVLGVRVRQLIGDHAVDVSFFDASMTLAVRETVSLE